MRPATLRQPATRTAAVLMALLAGFLVAPAAVEAAGCAYPHYLSIPDASAAAGNLDLLSALGRDAAPLPDPTTPAPTPCGSWRCHEAPSSPAPLTPITAPRGDFWLFSAAERSAQASALADRLAYEASNPRPIRVPTSVFHPPR